ncbi:hypothetical protein B0O99DRAFT_646957 [Bisporella sp. PMI_857]|nr:hypothetical protein B0O99DRAFT_646957 [Bisporella sp. PMI_857]
MRLAVAVILATLQACVFADSHDFGGCQTRTDGPLDDEATRKVAHNCNNDYTPAPAMWGNGETSEWLGRSSGPGPRFSGLFLQNVNRHTGGIDGDTPHRLCRDAGAGDSSAFNCKSQSQNSAGQWVCNS